MQLLRAGRHCEQAKLSALRVLREQKLRTERVLREQKLRTERVSAPGMQLSVRELQH